MKSPEQFEMSGIVQGLPSASSNGPDFDTEAFLAAFDKFGPLILRSDAATLLGVSHQRVTELVANGLLTGGLPRAMVALSEVLQRRARPRRAGRPFKKVA